MTPTPIKPTTVYKKISEIEVADSRERDDIFYIPGIGWTKQLPDRHVFSKQELEAHDKETLREFIDKYGEKVWRAGQLYPSMELFFSDLKAELGLNDNTTEK